MKMPKWLQTRLYVEKNNSRAALDAVRANLDAEMDKLKRDMQKSNREAAHGPH